MLRIGDVARTGKNLAGLFSANCIEFVFLAPDGTEKNKELWWQVFSLHIKLLLLSLFEGL